MKNLSILVLIITAFARCESQQTEPNARYKPFSNTVVKLKVSNNPADTLFADVSTLTNIPRDASSSRIAEMARAGVYYLDLQVDRPAISQLTINDSLYNIILLPDDTTEVSILVQAKGFEIQFLNSFKEINEYLLAKQRKMGYHDLRTPFNNLISKQSTYVQIASSVDSITKKEIDFLASHSPILPPWFIEYEQAEIYYSGIGFKQHMPIYNEVFDVFSDTVPENYYDFLSLVKVDNESAIFSSRYFWFLDDLFARDLRREEFDHLSGYSRSAKFVSHRQPKAVQALSGYVRRLYSEYQFGNLAPLIADSMELDSCAKRLDIGDPGKFKHIYGSRAKRNTEFRKLLPGDQVTEFFLTDTRDSLVSIRDFSDKVVYINFWATWCGPCLKNIPELNKMIKEFSGNDDVVFVNICLFSVKDKWEKTIRKTQLQGINLFPEGAWGEKLSAEFAVRSVPTYVILNKENKLFENHTDKAPLVKEKIRKLLKEFNTASN